MSVVDEGVAAGIVGTHGMHDITEGGIMGAIWEMCQISHTGAQIWQDQIPIEPETEKICSIFNIDPMRLISSGSMVIVSSPEKKDAMLSAMKEAGVRCTVVGRVEEGDFGIMKKEADGFSQIEPPYADEIYKVVGKK